MSTINRNIHVVVAEQILGSEVYDDDGATGRETIDFNQKAFTLDELLREEWFVDMLKERGFYSKDEVDTSGLTHLNKFVYEYASGQYKYYTRKLSDINIYHTGVSVFQEVIGPERIREVGKILKKIEEHKERLKKIANKAKDRQARQQEKLRLRRIESAKKLLEKEGLDIPGG